MFLMLVFGFLSGFHGVFSATHSLKGYFTLSAGLSVFPDFVAVGIVDEDTVGYFDSSIKRLQLRPQWAENIEGTFTDKYTEQLNDHMHSLKSFWKDYLEPHNQGIPTLQLMFGCHLDDKGKTGGYRFQYGYNGEDFLTLNMNNLSWIAANQIADNILSQDQNSAENEAIDMKDFLENVCIDALNVFIRHGREILERKVPPEVSLLQRDPSSPVTCLATGFFPKGIVVSWEKDGEDLHEDVELLETVPNEDGTFQTRSRLTVSPADLKKHKFTCIVDHISLERKIIKPVTEEDIKTNQERLPLVAVIVGVVVAVLFFLFISAVAGVMLWRNRRANALQGTDLRDLRYEVFNIGARQCVLSASDSFSDTTSNSTIPIAQGNSI